MSDQRFPPIRLRAADEQAVQLIAMRLNIKFPDALHAVILLGIHELGVKEEDVLLAMARKGRRVDLIGEAVKDVQRKARP